MTHNCYVRLHLEILPNAHHITSTHKQHAFHSPFKSKYIHQLFNTATEKSKAIQMSFSRSFTYLQLFTYRCPSRPCESCFFPSGSIQRHQKHGGFPLMALLQQNEIKRTTQGRGRKCQTCFIQLWKYERRCNLKDERGVREVRGQKVQAFFRDTYKVSKRNKRGNSKPTQQRDKILSLE